MVDGRQLAELPLPAAAGETLTFELPVASLGQGTYILRIRARQDPNIVEQLVAFGVTG
jgi:hypothetical protein